MISEHSICWGSPSIKRAHTPSRSWINQAHNKLCSPSATWGDCRLWEGGGHRLAIMIAFCPKQEKTGPTWLSRSCNLSVGAGLSSAWCLCLCRDTHFYLNSSVQEEQVDPGKRRFLFSGGRMCFKKKRAEGRESEKRKRKPSRGERGKSCSWARSTSAEQTKWSCRLLFFLKTLLGPHEWRCAGAVRGAWWPAWRCLHAGGSEQICAWADRPRCRPAGKVLWSRTVARRSSSAGGARYWVAAWRWLNETDGERERERERKGEEGRERGTGLGIVAILPMSKQLQTCVNTSWWMFRAYVVWI